MLPDHQIQMQNVKYKCFQITFLPTVLLPWFYAHWVLIGRYFLKYNRYLKISKSIFSNMLNLFKIFFAIKVFYLTDKKYWVHIG